jgi:hypothetical protein
MSREGLANSVAVSHGTLGFLVFLSSWSTGQLGRPTLTNSGCVGHVGHGDPRRASETVFGTEINRGSAEVARRSDFRRHARPSYHVPL